MKKLFYTTVLICAVALLASCGGNVSSWIGGAKYPADKADSYAKAIENVKKKTDLKKFKIFSIRFTVGTRLSNDLTHVTLGMVNPDNYAFTQTFYLDGSVGDMSKYPSGINVVNYEKVKGIDITEINTAKLVGNIIEAKKLIPEGHTYKSINFYETAEVLPRSQPHLNSGRKIGLQETSFIICFTEDGKETETSGGQVTHLYFEARVQVKPDGTLCVK